MEGENSTRGIDLNGCGPGAVFGPSQQQRGLKRLRFAPLAEAGQTGVDIGIAVEHQERFGGESITWRSKTSISWK